MILTINRTYRGSDCTLGVLTVADLDGLTPLTLQTIERPWIPFPGSLGGAQGRSCVPVGSYRLECHHSEAHPRTWALVNPLLNVVHWPVEGGETDRSLVLIHVANYAAELRGCIAPGMNTFVDPVRQVRMVTESRRAMKALQDLLNWSDEHELTIR